MADTFAAAGSPLTTVTVDVPEPSAVPDVYIANNGQLVLTYVHIAGQI